MPCLRQRNTVKCFFPPYFGRLPWIIVTILFTLGTPTVPSLQSHNYNNLWVLERRPAGYCCQPPVVYRNCAAFDRALVSSCHEWNRIISHIYRGFLSWRSVQTPSTYYWGITLPPRSPSHCLCDLVSLPVPPPSTTQIFHTCRLLFFLMHLVNTKKTVANLWFCVILCNIGNSTVCGKFCITYLYSLCHSLLMIFYFLKIK